MKKIVSLILIVCMCIVMMPLTAFSKEGDDAEAIRNQIQNVFNTITNNGSKSYQGRCAAFVCQQVAALGITKSAEGKGNGNQVYDNWKKIKTTSGGYSVIAYPGENCLYDLLNANNNSNVYNIIVGFQYSPYSGGDKYGHVVFIHAIIDGTAYFMESSKWNGVPSGGVHALSVSNFYKRYKNHTYDGAIHFTAGENVQNNGNFAGNVTPGTYYIISALNGEKSALDVEGQSTAEKANIHLWSFFGDKSQQWKIEPYGNAYKIINVNSGKAMDVYGGQTANGTNVAQYDFHGGTNQQFTFEDAGGGYYYIKPVSGAYVDVSGGKSADGTNIQVYKGNKTASQKFRLVPVTADEHWLDVNGELDGTFANLDGYGTVDVYINGSRVADDVSDYYKKHTAGTTYEIKDIKAKSGKQYDGVISGSLFGTIGSNDAAILLSFSTKATMEETAPQPEPPQTEEIHVHNYTTVGYDTAHPHKEYKMCSCGAKQYTGKTDIACGCPDCLPEKPSVQAVNIGSDGTVKANWTSSARADYYEFQVFDAATKERVFVNWTVYDTSFSTKLEPGSYYLHITAVNQALKEKDPKGSYWTRCDYYPEFTVDEKMGWLDVNAELDGAFETNLGNFGTFDVYINGVKASDDTYDYYIQHPYGTKYEIKDIKATNGKQYDGVTEGNLSGTIGKDEVAATLAFSTVKKGNLPGAFRSYTSKNSFTTDDEVYILWDVSENADDYGLTVVCETNGDECIFDRRVSSFAQNLGKLSPGTYRFNMRAYNNAGGGPVTEVNRFTVKDKENIQKYMLRFTGCIEPPLPMTVEAGKKVRISDEIPSKAGRTFLGWALSENAKTAAYQPGSTLRVDKDMTLYAVWSYTTEIVLTINNKTAYLNGSAVTNDVPPIIRSSRTMLPARFVAESLGASVGWDNSTRCVTIQNDGTTIKLYIGSDTAYVNGKAVILDSPAFIENDRTYTPVRFICENLGAEVSWNDEEKKVTITK